MIEVKQILDSLISSYNGILQENLVGIYLHGSLAMNCFNPLSSDIDFLVVVKENLSFNDMRKLIGVLLELSENGPKKGFEMSVLLEYDTKNFKYPTPFVLHYSDYHKERYLNQSDYICGNFEDPDLAAHIDILRARGKCLIGKPINEVFQEVPKKYYIESIKHDISTSREEILIDFADFMIKEIENSYQLGHLWFCYYWQIIVSDALMNLNRKLRRINVLEKSYDILGHTEKMNKGVNYILIQERCKPNDSEEDGLIEIPAGKIRNY